MATQSTPWQRPPTLNLRENPERLAWLVLLASFATFCVLAITIPAAIIYTVHYASAPQTAKLDPTLGTLFLYPEGKGEPIAVTDVRENIEEGARIVAADDSTQATLSLNSDPATGEALGSMQIYSGVDLTLQRLRRPLFGQSPESYHALLRMDAGQARLFTSSASERSIDVQLETPHGLIILAPGSYQVSVSPEETMLTVRNGQATLEQPSKPGLVVTAGQLAWMNPTAISDKAAPAGQNLVKNSTFAPPALDTWQSYQLAEASTTPGKVQFNESEDGRRVAQFLRMGEEKLHTEVGITQVVEQAVNVYDDLRLQLDVKILFQSLPGAGSLNSEFPLRVEVSYRDVYGKDLTWGHGFYYRDPEPGEAYPPVVNGTKVRQGQWYTYLSPNLISLLDSQGTRPAYINSIRVYASGHNYQSMTGEVYVLAE